MDRNQIGEWAIQYASEGFDETGEFQLYDWLAIASEEEQAIFSSMVDTCAELHLTQASKVPASEATFLSSLITESKHAEHNDEMLLIPEGSRDWIKLPTKGTRLLELSTRVDDGFSVAMIEIQPNCEFPAHYHKGVEMAYILEGDLEADGLLMHAGDFFRADAHTDHGKHFSPSGCKALMITATENYRHKSMKALSGVQAAINSCKKLLNKK